MGGFGGVFFVCLSFLKDSDMWVRKIKFIVSCIENLVARNKYYVPVSRCAY